MTEKLDAVLQELANLNETLADHNKTDQATIDKEQLAPVVMELLEQIEAAKPLRKEPVHGSIVSIDGRPPISRGPYKYGLGDPLLDYEPKFVRDGKFKGLRDTDVWFINALMAQNARFNGKGPSNELQAALKAMTSTGSATGDELVGEAFAREVWDDMHLAAKVAPLFVQIPMPAEKYTIPLELGDLTWRKGSQNTATAATDLATKKVTLDASDTEQVGETDYSYNLDEDSLVPILPEIKKTFARGAAENLDHILLNGDTTDAATGNINLDDADPDSDEEFLVFDGLRHLALVDNSGQAVNVAAAPSVTMFVNMAKNLGKYFTSPDRCAWIMDVQSYLSCIGIDEFLTVDKVGQRATLLSGQVASVFNAPVVISGQMGLTEADGKISDTAGNNTLGQALLVYRPHWYVGFRRQVLIEVDRDIQKRQNIVVVSFRPAFNCYGGASGDRGSQTHTAVGYNITV